MIFEIKDLAQLNDAQNKFNRIVVMFKSEWCYPCQKIGEFYRNFAKENSKLDTIFYECDQDEGAQIL